MRKSVLVTGGLGFLGHFLTRSLLASHPDCDLTVVDNLSSSRIDYTWLEERAEIRIARFQDLDPPGRRFDAIYHLASPVGSLGILERSGYIAREITDLAVRAGEWAARTGASLLYVSSSEIYGKSGVQREDDGLTVPATTGARMEYSLGKLAGEHLLRNMARRAGFRLTICRPFNVIGEHQSSRIGFVVPTFFERALSGKSLPLFNGGEQERCFCHAGDLAEGLIAVQERGVDGEIYNLGNPDNRISIRDLALRIRALCGSGSPLENVDPCERFGRDFIEASDKVPDIGKALAHVGWKPRLDLGRALRMCLEHYAAAEGRGHGRLQARFSGVSHRDPRTAV